MSFRFQKLFALGCALSAAVCVSSEAAEVQGWYAGVGVGYAQNKITGVTIPPNFSQKSSDTGYKIFGGYQFSPNWAAELEFVDFGKFKAESSFSQATVKTSGFGASVIGSLPLSSDFSVFGKLGAVAKFTKAEAQTTNGSYRYSQKKTSGNILAGVGAEYMFTPQLSLRAEYEYFGETSIDDGDAKVKNSLLSLGLRYRF